MKVPNFHNKHSIVCYVFDLCFITTGAEVNERQTDSEQEEEQGSAAASWTTAQGRFALRVQFPYSCSVHVYLTE